MHIDEDPDTLMVASFNQLLGNAPGIDVDFRGLSIESRAFTESRSECEVAYRQPYAIAMCDILEPLKVFIRQCRAPVFLPLCSGSLEPRSFEGAFPQSVQGDNRG